MRHYKMLGHDLDLDKISYVCVATPYGIMVVLDGVQIHIDNYNSDYANSDIARSDYEQHRQNLLKALNWEEK